MESPEIAVLTGFVRFAGHAADGRRLRFLDERITVTLRRQQGGDWLVSHQHTSEPVDGATMKLQMVRE